MPEMLHEAGLAERAKRFRTVAAAFHRNAELLFKGSVFGFDIDDEALARAFSAWRRNFDDLQDQIQTDRRDLLIFAGGLMLQELFQHHPLAIRHRGVEVLRNFPDAMTTWPEGYAYASCCVSLVAAVIEQEGLSALQPAASAAERQFWTSFRENVQEDARTAIGFFDLLCGLTPNWELPLQRRLPVPG
ncbi:MAG TPA: hypothetical protein VEC60_15665 [Reyranella sp.]|nr:hypothetical protein [Reyranella sp.]